MFTNFMNAVELQAQSFAFLIDASATFSAMMQILQKGMFAVSAFLIVMGAVQFGSAIRDSNGPGRQQAILEIAGGLMVGAAAAYITQITF